MTRPAPGHRRADEQRERTAAGRLLALLETFDERHPRLSLTDISRRSGLSLTTTHRLVGELVAWGGLARHEGGSYTLGLRIFELGSLVPQGLHLREIATPFLGDLRIATRANVHLGVRDGHDVLYLESLRASDGAPVLSRVGGRWPLQSTGTGLILLANADSDLQEEVLAGPLRRIGTGGVRDPDTLRRMLGEIRVTGQAVIDSAINDGVVAVAVPIRGEKDAVVASVAVTVPSGTPVHTLVPALLTTARAISRALGAPSARAPGRAVQSTPHIRPHAPAPRLGNRPGRRPGQADSAPDADAPSESEK
ncbi:MAG: IclR family transcriptional regulator [Actinomycetales bacterium]